MIIDRGEVIVPAPASIAECPFFMQSDQKLIKL